MTAKGANGNGDIIPRFQQIKLDTSERWRASFVSARLVGGLRVCPRFRAGRHPPRNAPVFSPAFGRLLLPLQVSIPRFSFVVCLLSLLCSPTTPTPFQPFNESYSG